MKKIIAHDLDELDGFHQEFEFVASCNHPNIMKIFGVCVRFLDVTTFALYVLMEMAINDWDKEIKEHLKIHKLYKEEELIFILKQLTSALKFMQVNKKIAHRDIKPQNILIFETNNKYNDYKVADFGEAKEVKISKQLNTLRGTELYMSPALYNGLKVNQDDVDHDPFKSDLFSLGFCLVYAATMNFNLLYELRNINNDEKIRIKIKENLKENYSETFIDIINKMVELDEKNRYDFKELSVAIEENYGK
jgi:serine/threonine protein kinase